ncbi:unnamed protein product [Ascophyllum nodosum]
MPLSLFLLVVVVVVASAAKGEMLLSSTLSRAPSPAFLRFNGAAPICWAVTWSRSSVGNRGGRLSSINSVSSCHGSGTSGVSRAATTMIAKPSQVVVLGATGRLGRRVVRELLVDDVAVTAAVRPSSVEKADAIFKDKNFMPEELLNKLEVVAVDLESGKELRDVMGKSQAVVCALGAAESEPFNIKGPSEASFYGRLSQNVVVAAKESPSIKHFVLVTALGTGKFGLPASLLNLFWGVLSYKRKTENLLLDSGLPYTILRPGGMERPGDDFEQTHNARIAPKDTLFGGVVSRLQVAKLAAAAVASPDDSTNKVMEIVAEDLAPKVSYNDLVAKAKDDQADEVWKNKLRPDQYYVLRMGGTEPAFTSPLNGEKREGAFVCAGCDQELFPSSTKYNSGTGWPSFFQPTSEESVRIVGEGGLFNRREVRCSSCDGHLGHVFPDGPRPTGLRYCMNGVALGFKPKTMTTVNQDKDQDKSQPVEGEAQQV